MGMAEIIGEYMAAVDAATDVDDLKTALARMTHRMGFAYFALTQHVDIHVAPTGVIRVHNYPDDWVDYFDRNRLAVSDPIHRASQRAGFGFRWSDVPRLISLTSGDHNVLARARDHGLVEGFTVPFNVPGEAYGSCSFALAPTKSFPLDAVPLAQLAGAFGFEGARRLWRVRAGTVENIPSITDRQRDCLSWVARGKTDWETSRILGVSPETVVQHIKSARERYNVQKRTTLLVRTLFDGTICFSDILEHANPQFWG